MLISRKRNAPNKVYLPADARDNHYMLAEFALTDELLSLFSPTPDTINTDYTSCYQALSESFFKLCQTFSITSCLMVANDKLVRVRFNHELHQWQTNQQIIFYYDPAVHQLQKVFFDAKVRAHKISLLFLASGTDIRLNAAGFHEKVRALLLQLSAVWQLPANDVRLRDHQHLTYDLFAKQKVQAGGYQCHKLRHLLKRYASQGVALPEPSSVMTYAIVNLILSPDLLAQVELDAQAGDPYNPLYAYLTDKFTTCAQRFNLNNGALIANGLIPIVRFSVHELIATQGELQMLGYNPASNGCGIISKWDARHLVDQVQLIFVATTEHCHSNSYAKFLNQIEQALLLLATELALDSSKHSMMIRFHQHLAYNL